MTLAWNDITLTWVYTMWTCALDEGTMSLKYSTPLIKKKKFAPVLNTKEEYRNRTLTVKF